MRTLIIPSLLAATIAGCGANPPVLPRTAGAPACIPLDRLVATRPAGPAAIDMEVVGGRVFRNRPATVCPGLERLGRFAAVAVVSGAESGRLCPGDRVRIFDPAEARATGLQGFPDCVLGDFVAVGNTG